MNIVIIDSITVQRLRVSSILATQTFCFKFQAELVPFSKLVVACVSQREARAVARGLPGTTSLFQSFSGSSELHWTHKLLIGLAAPLLVPVAVAAALLGLPILGGLAARGYVAERRSEQRARDYRADRLRYLASRTADAVNAFAKSSPELSEFVSAELRPALRCVQQLRDEVCVVTGHNAHR